MVKSLALNSVASSINLALDVLQSHMAGKEAVPMS